MRQRGGGPRPALSEASTRSATHRRRSTSAKVEASLGWAEFIQRSFLDGGVGKIAVERRADGAFLGIAGLSRLPWYPDDLEVGWRLRPAHWGQGYATEAGRAWLDLAFRRHDVARVISVADVPNERSRAVMERLGMRLDHIASLQDGEDQFEAAVHSVTRAAWGRQSPLA